MINNVQVFEHKKIDGHGIHMVAESFLLYLYRLHVAYMYVVCIIICCLVCLWFYRAHNTSTVTQKRCTRLQQNYKNISASAIMYQEVVIDSKGLTAFEQRFVAITSLPASSFQLPICRQLTSLNHSELFEISNFAMDELFVILWCLC